MSLYDPEPGKPYGTCSTCGIVIQTDEHCSHHLAATLPVGGSSHSVRVTNLTRAQRIKIAVQDFADEAASDFADNLISTLDEGDVTEDEIIEALRTVRIDLDEAWSARNV